MVLVDTSVWVSHFREGKTNLQSLLVEGRVLCHPFVIGELACGNLQNRKEILSRLKSLPQTATVQHDEVLIFIERHKLMGQGLGYVDMHLLASAFLSDVCFLTLDKKLNAAAHELGRAF